MVRRRHTLRRPFRGDRVYARPAHGRPSRPSRTRNGLRLARSNGPRMRPRRKVSVTSIVTTPPEEVPSRPGVRLVVIGVIVVLLFAVMVLRLWTLQVIDQKTYAAAVKTNQVRMVTVPAPRGLIVDQAGTVLVGNQVQNELVLSRVEATQDPSIIGRLATLVGKPAATIRAAITNNQYSPYQPVPILDPATTAVVQYVEAHQSEYPGVSIQQVTQRYYPTGGTTAAQVLGYVGPITASELKTHPGYSQQSQIGKTGLEQQYEKYLRGKHGQQALSVNATGTVVGSLTQQKPSQGDTLQTHLTLGLQKAVQGALAGVIAADRKTLGSPATNGAAVVMDAQTGAVLAMASYPSYNLTTWVGGISTSAYHALTSSCTTATSGCPLNNYAIDGLYTPGSTFKLATSTAALQRGLITPTTTIDDTGVFRMKTHGFKTCTGRCTFYDATAADAGIVTIRAAITRSDDFFFYTLGVQFYKTAAKYGVDALQTTAHSLGFGSLTGIDLPGEVQGRVDGKTERLKLHKTTPTAYPNTFWYPATALEVAFGQGGTVLTPIEMAQAYSTFADHGVKHQPEIGADILTPTGKLVKKIAPKVTGQVKYTPGNWTAMLQGFYGVTHTPTGTAYGIFQQYSHVPSTYAIAGKTGTATVNKTTKAHPPNAWFVGFGPLTPPAGQPEYVVVAAVNEAGYGDQAAAPAVANIFNYLYAHPAPNTPTPPKVTPGTTPASSTAAKGSTTTTTAPGHGTTTTTTTTPGHATTTPPGQATTTTTTTTTPRRTSTTTTAVPPTTRRTTTPATTPATTGSAGATAAAATHGRAASAAAAFGSSAGRSPP